MLNARTGTVPAEFSSPMLDNRRDRVLIATWMSGSGDGKVSILSARGDRVLTSVKVGGFPGPIIRASHRPYPLDHTIRTSYFTHALNRHFMRACNKHV